MISSNDCRQSLLNWQLNCTVINQCHVFPWRIEYFILSELFLFLVEIINMDYFNDFQLIRNARNSLIFCIWVETNNDWWAAHRRSMLNGEINQSVSQFTVQFTFFFFFWMIVVVRPWNNTRAAKGIICYFSIVLINDLMPRRTKYKIVK